MIEKTGNQGTLIKFPDTASRRVSFPNSEESQPPATDSYFGSTRNTSDDYIVIPPDTPSGDRLRFTLFKTTGGDPLTKDVRIKERLPVVDGVIAKLDDAKKLELKSAGYLVYKDKEEPMIPDVPWKDPGTDPGDSDPTGIRSIEEESKKAISLKERPPLEGPRFNTPLCKQFTGKGVGIAIIDSGIYLHPDFINPKNRVKHFEDFVHGRKMPYDDNGHGTHVAGDAAGNGFMSEGLYSGPAPEADIISLKALSGQGGGKTSHILKAIQWAIDNKEKYNIRVLNMSLGHLSQKDYWNDPMDIAVKKAFEAGILVICSAGNRGPKDHSISAPGDCPYALSVAALDDWNTYDKSDDKIAPFSSRGPANGGQMKPDIAAPGEGMIAALSPGTSKETSGVKYLRLKETMNWYFTMPDDQLMSVPKSTLEGLGFSEETIDKWYKGPDSARKEIKRIFEAAQRRIIIDTAYVTMPGTSMAAPTAAGIAGKIFEANPDLTAGQVLYLLKHTADKLKDVPEIAQGRGVVDPEECLQMALDAKAGKITIPEEEIHWFEPGIQLELPFPDDKDKDKDVKPE